tara:strand:- start:1097 stop:1618 length:522 start_codon:yes stop_codon:yes gene_type:complete
MALTTVSVSVPDGLGPGESFDVTTTWGHKYAAAVPDGAGPGETISLEIPATEEADEQMLTAVYSQLFDAGLMWKIFEFGKEHAHMVSGKGRTGAMCDPIASYSLETHEAHSKFCAMVESVLEEHIVQTLGIPLADFVMVVQRRGGVEDGTEGAKLLKARAAPRATPHAEPCEI